MAKEGMKMNEGKKKEEEKEERKHSQSRRLTVLER